METDIYEDPEVPESDESKNLEGSQDEIPFDQIKWIIPEKKENLILEEEKQKQKLCKIKVEENLINVECDKPLTMSLRSLDKKCGFKDLWYKFSGEENPIKENINLTKPGRDSYLRCCKRCNENFWASSKFSKICYKCYRPHYKYSIHK